MGTKRTISALMDLFAPGQAEGSITPDRVQDLVETLRGGWGRIRLDAPAATNITAQNVFVKAAGTTIECPECYGFDMPEDNRLRYTGSVEARIEVAAGVNVTDGANRAFELAFAVNGVIREETARVVRLGPGGDVEGAVLLGDFRGNENDYVEIWIRNLTDTQNPTLTRLYLRARAYVL